MLVNNGKPIILFDDSCKLCKNSTGFIKMKGGKDRFHFESLHTLKGKQYLKKIGFPDNYNKSIVLLDNNQVYSESEAVLLIFRRLRGLWSALYILKIIPRPIRDFFYRFVSKYRHRMFTSKIGK